MVNYSIDFVAKALGLNPWKLRYWYDNLYVRRGRPKKRNRYEPRVLSERDFQAAKKALTGTTVLVCGGDDFVATTSYLRETFGAALEVRAVSLNALQEVTQNCRPCCIIIDAAETTRRMVLKVIREIRVQPSGRAIHIHSLFTTTDKSVRIASHTTRSELINELKSQFQVNS
jgi:hypothetical protein